MNDETQAMLLAAQERALEVLSAARAEAMLVANDAAVEAPALLLEQQARAKRLLDSARSKLPRDIRSIEDINTLLESHRTAAELLAASEREVAAKLDATMSSAAVDVLMAAHREAAAILLRAWMRATEE